ncbi:MAG: NAD(+) synthase [Flavobacteriaceae bacterium]
MKSPEKVIHHIVEWMKDYALTNHQKGFVVGVSGGIDSAVTSTLCARTGLPTIALEMPIHQQSDQVSRAQEHLQWLKNNYPQVETHRVSLTEVFESLRQSLPATNETTKAALSLANTRARLRMSTLYYFAALNNFLVAGTGNKIEDFGVGFYTKYGDGGVDLSPIADLMKSEVYQLASEMNIITSIQEAAPTDGLWADNRTDEEQMGATYDELEWAMRYDSQGANTTLSQRQEEVLKRYRALNRQNQHKMLPIPVCEIPENLLI